MVWLLFLASGGVVFREYLFQIECGFIFLVN